MMDIFPRQQFATKIFFHCISVLEYLIPSRTAIDISGTLIRSPLSYWPIVEARVAILSYPVPVHLAVFTIGVLFTVTLVTWAECRFLATIHHTSESVLKALSTMNIPGWIATVGDYTCT